MKTNTKLHGLVKNRQVGWKRFNEMNRLSLMKKVSAIIVLLQSNRLSMIYYCI
jgi:hypothetical protein